MYFIKVIKNDNREIDKIDNNVHFSIPLPIFRLPSRKASSDITVL